MKSNRITKLLIANRGEIACRIKRACDKLGIPTVQVVSDADRGLLAARTAHQCAYIGGSTARESYLDIEKILTAAREFGCDAIHPGYGFLSENSEFADAVSNNGLVFVGPSAASIRALGNKPNARKAAREAGVPITEGSEGLIDDEELEQRAVEVGFPVIIKAAAGGGGRGMRIVRERGSMKESLERARAEALKNFGSAEVYFEKFVEEPRHVEVQLFGDTHGNVIHFGTRDCSAQRRHQKLVEEAPAPFLTPETRERIHQAAVRAAKSVGYYNAGTAEFLVKEDKFFFLEINTRIQVEHPVTEKITGIDLVQLQLQVAMGNALPLSQEEVSFSGHAVEFRINAEDPVDGFRPCVGTIEGWRRGDNPDVREDYGYEAGDVVPPYYDSLLSKVIVAGTNRADALAKAFRFFRTYSIAGIPTSVPFHKWLLSNKEFQETGIDIGYVERVFTPTQMGMAASISELDPAHKEALSIGSAAVSDVERKSFSRPSGEVQFVDLVHEFGGTFLGIPLSDTGAPLSRKMWRRSTSQESVLTAIQEMLGTVK